MSQTSGTGRDVRVGAVLADYYQQLERGDELGPQELIARHPELAAELKSYFATTAAVERIRGSRRPEAGPPPRAGKRVALRVSLTVTAGPHKGKVFTFAGHDTFLVGRSKQAHFRLSGQDRYFSRTHFLVEVNPPYCRLIDMGSRNGTYVNKQKVTRAELHDGDRIQAGHTVLRVAVEQHEPPPPAAPASAPAPPAPVHTLLQLSWPQSSVRPLVAQAGATSQPCLVCQAPAADASPLPTAGATEAPSLLLCPGCQAQVCCHEQRVPGYHMVRELGRGGKGIVSLAVQTATGQLVALKTIQPVVHVDLTDRERFLREAQILQQLDHPHIVAFHDLGDADGLLYFAMEYVRGTDAGDLLKREGPLPVGRAVDLICQVLEALAYAHAKGFVHRDIKPPNMLITQEEGREFVKLADFGLARVYGDSQMSGPTQWGDPGGTPVFMPPEQITNFRGAQPPADQYSTAATLYNLLTGAYVMDEQIEVGLFLHRVLHKEPIPIQDHRKDLPPQLAAAIHRALAKDPAKRFKGVKGMRRALLPFASEGGSDGS